MIRTGQDEQADSVAASPCRRGTCQNCKLRTCVRSHRVACGGRAGWLCPHCPGCQQGQEQKYVSRCDLGAPTARFACLSRVVFGRRRTRTTRPRGCQGCGLQTARAQRRRSCTASFPAYASDMGERSLGGHRWLSITCTTQVCCSGCSRCVPV